MSKSIWKLGKFHKGINSHTDPKDIDDSEWAELDDVNVSKVGIAKLLGKPIKDSSILDTSTGNLIGGRGLYRFSSDNAFVQALPQGNSNVLTNTINGGGGAQASANFLIESLVWLFAGKPTSVAINFQLTIGNTPIMDAMPVLSGDLAANVADSTTTDTANVFNDTDFADDNEDHWIGGGEDMTAAVWGNIPHTLVQETDYSDTNSGGNDVQCNSSGNSVTSSADFWRQQNHGTEYDDYENNNLDNNLNQEVLPFSATFNAGQAATEPIGCTGEACMSTGQDGDYPNGTNTFWTHYMLGFYKWDGYFDDVLADGGMRQTGSWSYTEDEDFVPDYISDSAFAVPLGADNSQNIYHANYKKTRSSFHSNLIKAINAYSGADNARYYSNWDSGGGWWEDGDAHITSDGDDIVYIESKNSIAHPGDGKIRALITCSAVSGATFDSTVTLLTSVHRNGTGYGYNDGNTWPGNYYAENHEVRDTVGAGGGSMVLIGDTEVQAGSDETNYETYVLDIRGNPDSGDTIELNFQDQAEFDGAFTDSDEHMDIQIIAEYSNDEFSFAGVIRATILSNVPSPGRYTCSLPENVSTEYSNDTFDVYRLTISTSIIGNLGRFSLSVHWEDTNNQTILSSQGRDDEQLCLISNSSLSIDPESQGLPNLIPIDFKIWSKESYYWVHEFNHGDREPLTDGPFYTDINDVQAKNNSNRYLNWFSTSNQNSDPSFYDEGNILRISESNFELKKELDMIFEESNVDDNVFNNPSTGALWGNVAQWMGYKDLSGQFTDSSGVPIYDIGSLAVEGFFIGQQPKIWRWSSDTTGFDSELLRRDNTSDTQAGISTKVKMNLKTYKQADAGGLDWVGVIKIYAVACYDDGSESLPGHKFTTNLSFGEAEGAEDGDTLRIQTHMQPSTSSGERLFDDVRVNGVRLYYTHSEEGFSTFWNLGKYDFSQGFIKATTINTVDNNAGNESIYSWVDADDGSSGNYSAISVKGEAGNSSDSETGDYIEYVEMPKTEAYEDINGCSPHSDTFYVDYKAATIAGRRTFIGNIRHWNGSNYEYYNDRMIVSPINSLDVFPYPDNILDLEISDGDKIIALASYGDKLIQFKEKICYILNISTGIASEFFVEERFKWKGILNKNHYCSTDAGIFWVNKRGAWIYDGIEIKDIFINEDSDKKQQKISSVEWDNFISEDTVIGYNAPSREIIIVKSHTHSSSDDSDCFIYSLIVDSWTKGKKRFFTSIGKSFSNFQNIGNTGKIVYISESRADGQMDEIDIR